MLKNSVTSNSRANMGFETKTERLKEFECAMTSMSRRHSDDTTTQLFIKKKVSSTRIFLVHISRENFEHLFQESSIVLRPLQIGLLPSLKDLVFNLT